MRCNLNYSRWNLNQTPWSLNQMRWNLDRIAVATLTQLFNRVEPQPMSFSTCRMQLKRKYPTKSVLGMAARIKMKSTQVLE